MHPLTRTVFAAGALGAGCVAYGTFIERRWYRLHRTTLPGVLRRPGALRVLHVSDIHLVPGQQHRIDFLAELGHLDHDVAVATGDLLGAPDTERLVAEALAPLTSGGRPGLAVLGSNDMYGPEPKNPFRYFRDRSPGAHEPGGRRLDTELLVSSLAEHGYRTLIDEAALVETPAGTIAVGALHDPHLGGPLAPPEQVAPPTPADGSEPILHLGLVHAPYLAALDVLVDAGHDLVLSGHTHGGQVRLPGIGALVANCDLPLDQARGASRYRDRWLHVSAGLGHSRYAPFRFACRPEATLLELTG